MGFQPTEGANLRDVIGEAVGYASMCWWPLPAGTFQSDQATEAVEAIIEAVEAECAKHAPQEEPLLGLATTGDLLSELETRFRIPTPDQKASSWIRDIADNLRPSILNYRTVDSNE